MLYVNKLIYIINWNIVNKSEHVINYKDMIANGCRMEFYLSNIFS